MQRMALIACLICAPLWAQDPVPAAEEARVAELIGRLGDDKWEVRERAQRELVGIGEPARMQLVATLEHTDLEARSRASSALISIGESFAHAVECAQAKTQGRKDHGKQALQSLFRIDDPRNLRALGLYEMQQYYNPYYGREDLRLSGPPALAIARLESLSGMRVFVSGAAAESWQRVMSQAVANLSTGGDLRQVQQARNCLMAITRGGQTAQSRIDFVPMRVGRHTFFYVVPESVRAGEDLARRAGEEMINALLGDGPASVRAAALLAEGAATDVGAVESIRKEYLGRPDSLRLMWLALALGSDEAVAAAVRGADPAPVLALLQSNDWTALGIASRYFESLDAQKRGELLAPVVRESKGTLALTCALWWARGCALDDAARERALKLLETEGGQDALGAAAVRWFAALDALSDAELEKIWQVAESKPTGSALFEAALELVQRPAIAERLVEKARKSLEGTSEGAALLAAAALKGRATGQDLERALGKLGRDNIEMGLRVAKLFENCAQLDDAAQEKLVDGLLQENDAARARNRAVLRACARELQVSLVARWAVRITAAFEGDASRVARKFVQSRISLWSFQARLGDVAGVGQLMELATGADPEQARWAGAALPDAMEEKALLRELEALKMRQGAPNAITAANEACMELCRRAALQGDRAVFRKYQGLLVNQNNQAFYQLRNELQQLQSRLNRLPDKDALPEPLPRNPVLDKLEVQ